ncbi:MAG: hypothetical protein P4L76_02910 [Beijerinckiaceae bacterium]|nr:hypothetical protein [Beijerinckiaceae bacterium]
MRQDPMIAVEEKASAYISQSMRDAFCGALRVSGLSPLAVLELAALALGVIYHEAACLHHQNNDCPCGWQPEEGADIETLRTALTIGAVTIPPFDLNHARALGRA